MATIWEANKDIQDLVRSAMQEFHPELFDAKVTVTTLMAQSEVDDKTGEPRGPAVTAHGYPAAAKIKIASKESRIIGSGDVIITIDCECWEQLSADQRGALLDHELAHIEIDRDKKGKIKVDDYGRPKLKMRKHDWQIGGFDDVVQRHGANAVELLAVTDMMSAERPVRQLVFNWG